VTFDELVIVTLRQSAPLMLVAFGGLFSYHVGVINIAMEAEMLAGAFAGIVVASWTERLFAGLLAAVIAAVIIGLVFSLLTEYLQTHLVPAALGLNIFTVAFTRLLMWVISGSRGAFVPQNLPVMPSLHFSPLANIPVLKVIFGYTILVYAAWLAWLFTDFCLFHTRLGLRIRAVGEHPEAAKSAGLNVRKIRVAAQTLCAILCGLGGAQLSLGDLRLFTSGITAGKGFIALAAIYFGRGRPGLTTLACLLFGFFDALQSRLQIWTKVPPQLAQMIPFLTVVIVLVFVSWQEARRRLKV